MQSYGRGGPRLAPFWGAGSGGTKPRQAHRRPESRRTRMTKALAWDREAGGSHPVALAGPLRDLRVDVGRLIRILPLDQGVQAVPVGGEQGLDAVRAYVRD